MKLNTYTIPADLSIYNSYETQTGIFFGPISIVAIPLTLYCIVFMLCPWEAQGSDHLKTSKLNCEDRRFRPRPFLCSTQTKALIN